MFRPNTADSTDPDVFYVEQASGRRKLKSQTSSNSADSSEVLANEVITISSVASPQPHIVTFESDSNEPTLPSGYGRHQPKIPPSLNDLKKIPAFQGN